MIANDSKWQQLATIGNNWQQLAANRAIFKGLAFSTSGGGIPSKLHRNCTGELFSVAFSAHSRLCNSLTLNELVRGKGLEPLSLSAQDP